LIEPEEAKRRAKRDFVYEIENPELDGKTYFYKVKRTMAPKRRVLLLHDLFHD
jgi:hypothetical protein